MSISQDSIELKGTSKGSDERSHQLSDDHVSNITIGEDEAVNRDRKWTEKGKGYFSEVRGNARKHAYTAVLTQIERIRLLLNENENLETLERERDRLDKLRDAFSEAQEAYNEVIDGDEDRQASYRWFDMCDRKYFDMRLQLVARIRSLQESSPLKSNKSRTGSLKSQNSMRTKASSVSRKSKASSSRSLKLEAAVKTARLKTEMTFLERDNEIRRMQLTKEIAIAEAEERAINDALVEECKDIEVKQEPTKTLDPFAPPQIPYSPPCQSRDIKETKPKVTQINPQDNPGNSPPKVPSQQQENSVANQEIKAADSPIVPPICQQSPTQETLKELISLQAKQTELGSLLIQ